MKIALYATLFLSLILFTACEEEKETADKTVTETALDKTPNEMLKDAYQLFKEGDDAASIKLANTVLEIGRETKNDTLIGRALTSLCRNAQRNLDTLELAKLSNELQSLAASSGNEQWLMYRAHQNAEMWRLIGNMDRADSFYRESMRISKATGAKGMYMIDHFNKSFVSTAKGNYKEANDLIKTYYKLRQEADPNSEDAYGLIALAYLLEQQKKYKGAYEVALVCRRLFKEQNIFPEPPDEKPLVAVEEKVKDALEPAVMNSISTSSQSATVSNLLNKYLE